MLLKRLDRCLDVTLTLISAPAGSGKTRLVTDWIRSRQQSVGWVSLDREDTDLAKFITYLIAAIRTVYPHATPAGQMTLNMPGPLSSAAVATALLQDLEELPGPLLLVLDDYYLAESPAIRDVLQRVLQMAPPGFHLIVTTRFDPSLPLARLRSQFQLLEIRNAELRFTSTEAAHFLEALAGKAVDDNVTSLLREYTEGWAVGLQMAGILLQSAADQQALALQFAQHNHRWVADYLVDEVLANLPDIITRVLLWSALFERFCAALLETALVPAVATIQGEEVIEYAVQANLFVIPLDDVRAWYRYHHVFKDLLLESLHRTASSAEVRQVHLRASHWFEEQGLIDDAITHAHAAREDERAIRLIETNLYRALNNEDVHQLARWLDRLSEQSRMRPALLVAQAYQHQWRFQVDALPPLLDEAEAALAANRVNYPAEELTAWQGAIATMRAYIALEDMDPTHSLELSELALQLAPPTWLFVRGLAELSRALALQQMGNPQQAIAVCRRSLAGSTDRPDVRTLRLLLALCGVYYGEANADEIVSVAATYLQIATQLNRPISIGWACLSSGWGHYQRNEVDAAEADFRALVAIRDKIHVMTLMDGYTGLALTLAAQGRTHDAHVHIRELREFLIRRNALSLVAVADSLTKRLQLMQGERLKLPPVDDLARYHHQDRSGLWESPVLTKIRICIDSGSAKHLEKCGDYLAAYREDVRKANQTIELIELEVLIARYHIALGATDAALEAVARGVTLARAGGVVRAIADEGPSLIPYLDMLVSRNIEREHTQRILAAYRPRQPDKSAEATMGPTDQQSTDSAHDLASELTFREMEVLALVAQNKTNEEIADQLVIALPTVKRHISNILKKLHVSNRRAAARRALALGLVAPPGFQAH